MSEVAVKPRMETTDIVGYILAVLVPFIGFIVGLIRLNKSKHGIWIVVLSTAVFMAYILVTANGMGSA